MKIITNFIIYFS